MTYDLEFHKLALKEWKKLNDPRSVEKKLKERSHEPRIASSQLLGMKDTYKIKLRQSGYRLVYVVFENRVVVQVISVGKREKNSVYDLTFSRKNQQPITPASAESNKKADGAIICAIAQMH